MNSTGTALDALALQRVFSGLVASYPVNIFDSVSAIVYYDWNSEKAYLFAGYQKTHDAWKLNIMAYTSDSGIASYLSGNGIRLMLTYNH